ncbi:LbetaH domain-containing protein [Entomobacter blattae]|nr:hypothetical protein [Entomobacter blattae]
MKSFSGLANYLLHNQPIIGPYARIRPELKVKEGAPIGNFVEIKSAHIAEKTKIHHLSSLLKAFAEEARGQSKRQPHEGDFVGECRFLRDARRLRTHRDRKRVTEIF